MTETAKSITVKYPICLKNNPINQKRPPPVTTNREIHLEITAKYVSLNHLDRNHLVLVGEFSGWPEAFPCHTNKTGRWQKLCLNYTNLGILCMQWLGILNPWRKMERTFPSPPGNQHCRKSRRNWNLGLSHTGETSNHRWNTAKIRLTAWRWFFCVLVFVGNLHWWFSV